MITVEGYRTSRRSLCSWGDEEERGGEMRQRYEEERGGERRRERYEEERGGERRRDETEIRGGY